MFAEIIFENFMLDYLAHLSVSFLSRTDLKFLINPLNTNPTNGQTHSNKF